MQIFLKIKKYIFSDSKSFLKLKNLSYLIYYYFMLPLLMVYFDCQMFSQYLQMVLFLNPISDKIINRFILIVVNGDYVLDGC